MLDAAPAITAEEFRLIGGLVVRYCGIRIAPERANAMAARLAPRLSATHCDSFQAYYHLLKYDGDVEIRQAVELLTNHETYFFREVSQLHLIARLATRSRRRLRILSAGCSTGEEPYSIAMLIEQVGLLGRADIMAIDLSFSAVERARTAAYSANSFRGVDGGLVEQYFTAENGRMRLSPSIRDAVSFERINLLDEEALAGLGTFDVVLCRNVLIYFSPEGKARAIGGLVGLLNSGGYLFLGHSESLFDTQHSLEIVRSGRVIAHRKPLRPGQSDGVQGLEEVRIS